MTMTMRPDRDGESGQVLVLAAFLLVIVMGFSALAIDVGSWLHTRTKLQADVDAMALAGALVCSNNECRTASIAEAQLYGTKNELPFADIEFIRTESLCEGACEAPTSCAPMDGAFVTVQARTTRPPFLAQVLGVGSADIAACSTASGAMTRTQNVGGFGYGVRPFALERKCLEEGPSWPAIVYGSIVTLKFDSNGKGTCQASQGNFAALAIDGPGSSTYTKTIEDGSKSPVCADSTPGCCPSQGSSGCNGSYGVYLVDTEPGNMTGPSRTGINYLMNNTPSSCNTWNEVQTNGALNPACTPWEPGYEGATRILIVPVVDGLGDGGGRHEITIKRFAIVFLEGFQGKCTGNECDIKARFIQSTVSLDMISTAVPCGGSGEPACSDVTTTVTAGTKLVQ